MESKVIPFDYEAAVRLVLDSGRSFECGPEPVAMVIDSCLPPALKAQILQEFLDHTEELASPANFVPEEIIAGLQAIR